MSTTNWANRGKAAIAAAAPQKGRKLTSGGGGEIKFYNTPTTKYPNPANKLEAGVEFTGTYEGAIESKQFGSLTHKVGTSEGMVGIPGSGQLNKALAQVNPGTNVTIVYKGKQAIQTGKYAGKEAHTYDVFDNTTI